MVLVQQEIYPNVLTEFADIILPAAPWGEDDFARMRGERRLRIYSKIMDPPGDAMADWWIVAQVAKRMGFDGFDWTDSNDVFEEAAERSRGTVHDYAALVELARTQGRMAHELLREIGTTGIQCPVRLEGESLVGTVRLHSERFLTSSGKAILVKGDWNNVWPFREDFAPQGDELWVTNMRTNEHWQSRFDDVRILITGSDSRSTSWRSTVTVMSKTTAASRLESTSMSFNPTAARFITVEPLVRGQRHRGRSPHRCATVKGK